MPEPHSVRHATTVILAGVASLVLAHAASPLTIGTNIAGATTQEDGETAYIETGCARCHSVEEASIEATVSERMQGPDLSTVGADHDAAWIVDVVKKTVEPNGRAHRAPFRGTDEQLRALAEWLAGLDSGV